MNDLCAYIGIMRFSGSRLLAVTSALLVLTSCLAPRKKDDSTDAGFVFDASGPVDASTPMPRCSGTPAMGSKVEVVVDQEARDAILGLIDSAQTCLDVFEFELLRSGSAYDVQTKIIEAAQRGVHVRVLLDDEVESNESAARRLRSFGVNARVDDHHTRTHLKIIAADGATLMIGSTNLSGSSIDRNHETNVLVRDTEAVNFLMDYLDALWVDPGFRPENKIATHDGPVVPWLDGGYALLAMPAIASATVSIDVITYGMNLDPRYPDGPVAQLANALGDAVSRGIPVRVLLEQSNWNDILNEINTEAAEQLRAKGIWVRFDDFRTTTHAKLLITDSQAMVGTNNWSYSGVARDHEAGVLIDIPEVVTELQAYFDTQWRAAE